MNNHISLIEQSFADRNSITSKSASKELVASIEFTLEQLDRGALRVAEPVTNDNNEVIVGKWQVNQWVKKAILLSLKIKDNQVLNDGVTQYFDKIDCKYTHYSNQNFIDDSVRVVPQAIARKGAFIGKNAVLMPSYVNIGAFVDEGTMVDTWATVGSCAQIGKNVHLSGGAGIGGVLEPLQANPTIIEDNCFIGARSEIVEGVIVETNSVISMGVFIGQSTKIYNRDTGEVIYGRVPQGSVVVPGSLPSANGKYNLNCVVIVKQVDEKTRAKTSINELLRPE